MQNNKVKTLKDFGQSIWLDFFDRKIMSSGELKRLIDEDGITGVTSNPTIFEKAINGSSDYDQDIVALSLERKTNEAIFIGLVVKDIKRAADFFQSIYVSSLGEEGFVSLEVSPDLAYDTEGTIKQARQLWQWVDRPNVMIKIPATEEGIPAIRRCISEGININITLIFGLPRYAQVVEAYLSGMEDRVKAHLPITEISSVASFFLSRIDALTDPLLEKRNLLDLKGELAVASAKKAYELYTKIFNGERFKRLEAKAARKQRLLWASTSTKDPSYSDVKYVEAMIGPQTINTLPLETLRAFKDHGKPANNLEKDLEKATGVLAQLSVMGVDIQSITQQLEAKGIEKFNKAYGRLLEAIDQKTKSSLRRK